jgi:hypothetical protein
MAHHRGLLITAVVAVLVGAVFIGVMALVDDECSL